MTKWCADVAAVGKLPKLGDCWHMKSVDEILRLRPTLVIGSVPYKQETVANLLEQKFNFLAMNPRTLTDIEADIRLLGGITQRAGGDMVVAAGEKITEAQVAAARPDVIVLAWAATGTKSDPKQAYKVAEWKEVPAIQNRNVHVIRDELLNTPGPPLVEGAHALYKLLHRVNGMREHA